MQELTNIVKRKYIVTVEVTVDRDQVTERPDAVEAIEEAIDNEMHYFNESLLPGSVKDIIEEHLQDIESEIHNHQPGINQSFVIFAVTLSLNGAIILGLS
jgi:hypothetical protein